MQNNTHNRKMIKLPSINPDIKIKKTLPFNDNAVTEKSFSFSFSRFDRTHKLFNLGANAQDKTVTGSWFIELIDCLKNISNMTFCEVKQSTYDLHPINWSTTNTTAPYGSEQYEFWQFRINKSKGRVIGFLIDNIFYIVWLDPHHNLTDSAGYETATYYKAGLSTYELQEDKIEKLKKENQKLKDEIKISEELLDDYLKTKK